MTIQELETAAGGLWPDIQEAIANAVAVKESEKTSALAAKESEKTSAVAAKDAEKAAALAAKDAETATALSRPGIDLFKLQTDCSKYWPVVYATIAQMQEKAVTDTAIAVAAAKVEIQGTLDGLVSAAEAAAAQLTTEGQAILAPVIASAGSYTSNARALAKAQKLATLQSEIDALDNDPLGITIGDITAPLTQAYRNTLVNQAVVIDLGIRNGSLSPSGTATIRTITGTEMTKTNIEALAFIQQYCALYPAT